MKLLPLLYEDHTVANFRPLSWSWPVFELRCGMFSLRERCHQIHRASGHAPTAGSQLGLLSRGYLQNLHTNHDVAVGVENILAAAAGVDKILFVNGRLGPRWDVLAALWTECLTQDRFAWQDKDGLLALGVDPATGQEWLADWLGWERRMHAENVWTDSAKPVSPWPPPQLLEGWCKTPLGVTGHVWWAESPESPGPTALADVLTSTVFPAPVAFRAIWDLVPANGAAISADIKSLVAGGQVIIRQLYGIRPVAGTGPGDFMWRSESPFESAAAVANVTAAPGVHLLGSEQIWIASDVQLFPTTVLDASAGPIVLDRAVRIMPHSHLVGPVYVGPGTLIKAGTRLGGEVSVGAMCKIAGEVAETIISDFSNKQHDGFIGHAVLGSWINLGAGTTCSDLKNNYGAVRVDLGYGPVETDRCFVGVLMGDHSKTAIGTQLNTGSCVGFSSNVFGDGFPPKYLPNFTWGAGEGAVYAWEKAVETARVVMGRRGCDFTPEHEALFCFLAGHEA